MNDDVRTHVRSAPTARDAAWNDCDCSSTATFTGSTMENDVASSVPPPFAQQLFHFCFRSNCSTSDGSSYEVHCIVGSPEETPQSEHGMSSTCRMLTKGDLAHCFGELRELAISRVNGVISQEQWWYEVFCARKILHCIARVCVCVCGTKAVKMVHEDTCACCMQRRRMT